MIKQVIEIINHEENYLNSYPREISYQKNQINLRFHNFGEIRMGMDACQVEIFRNGKKLDNFLKKNYLASIPSNYDPFSISGIYGFIPTCQLNKEKLIIFNIGDLSKIYLEDITGGVLGNCFSKTSDKELIITTTNKIFFFDISRNILKPLDYDFAWPDFPTVLWSNKTDTIIIIEKKSKQAEQNIIAYNVLNDLKEFAKLKKPSDIFDFKVQPFSELTKKNDYCLFREGSSTVGYMLNKWDNIEISNENNCMIASTLLPTSEIYFNDKWGEKGCNVESKYAKIEIFLE